MIMPEISVKLFLQRSGSERRRYNKYHPYNGTFPMEAAAWILPLKDALANADNLRVRPGPMQSDYKNGTVLLHETDMTAIQSLLNNTHINATLSGVHCMCLGDPWLEFYSGEIRLLTLGFHHGLSLRWNEGPWKGDAVLTVASSEYYLQWLEQRGVNGPRRQVEDSRQRSKESARSWEKWLVAVPHRLRGYVDDKYDPNGLKEVQLAELIHEEIGSKSSDVNDYIVDLFRWNGSGVGLWSGFPYYEVLPELLLLKYPTPDLLAAIKDQELKEPLIEGVARLFGGSDFVSTRQNDKKLLPKDLKARLLEHCLKSDDDDKKRRARRAFGQ
jgi:hypothetical protein